MDPYLLKTQRNNSKTIRRFAVQPHSTRHNKERKFTFKFQALLYAYIIISISNPRILTKYPSISLYIYFDWMCGHVFWFYCLIILDEDGMMGKKEGSVQRVFEPIGCTLTSRWCINNFIILQQNSRIIQSAHTHVVLCA